MATETKLPVTKTSTAPAAVGETWQPFQALRNEIDQIFDPFYRGRRAVEDQVHGTGLGLSLAKRIIEAHRGTITVQSEQGKGTEFLVRIPAVRPQNEFADTAD